MFLWPLECGDIVDCESRRPKRSAQARCASASGDGVGNGGGGGGGGGSNFITRRRPRENLPLAATRKCPTATTESADIDGGDGDDRGDDDNDDDVAAAASVAAAAEWPMTRSQDARSYLSSSCARALWERRSSTANCICVRVRARAMRARERRPSRRCARNEEQTFGFALGRLASASIFCARRLKFWLLVSSVSSIQNFRTAFF